MATSFIKSFMEAVNLATAKAREALKEWPNGPEIVVIPQTVQMGSMDDIDTVEILADEVAPEDLPQHVLIHRCVPIKSDEESIIDPDVLTTIDETGSGTGDIADDAKFYQDAATEYQLAYQSLDKKIL